MWWVMLSKGYRPVSLTSGYVNYTRHSSSLTSRPIDNRMSWSLGVCAGIALSMARTPADILRRRCSRSWAACVVGVM